MRLIQVFCVVSGLIVAASAIPNAIEPNAVDLDEAKRSAPKLVHYKGTLGITAANGTFIGYASKKLSRFGTYVATHHKHDAASISFKASKFGKSKDLLLKDETAKFHNAPFIGVVIPRGFSLASGKRAGSASSAKGAGSGPTNPNQPPASGPNSFDPSGNNHPPRDIDDDSENKRSNAFQIESAIWTFDARHKSITGSFINPNRKPVTVELFYNPQSPPGVDLVSDVHAYKRANHHAFPITVEFISH